jgi:hypothetical protein
MEAQSSPYNDKPAQQKPSSDLNALFEELEKRPSRQPQAPLAPPPSRSGTQALLGSGARRSVPPPPPPASKTAPVVAAPAPAPVQRIDDEAELIEDDDADDADATGKREASSLDALLPKYDADVDDAPTVARASPLSFPVPSRRPTPAPPPSSVRLPPPPSMRPSKSPSSIARVSAPAAPLKSANELPIPSRGSLPALTPPPSRVSSPAPSRQVPSRPQPSRPTHAISAPLPSAPPTSMPAASVVVADSRPQHATIPPVSRSDSLAVAPAPKKKSSGGVFLAVAGLGLLVAAAAVGIGFKDRLLAAAGAAPAQGGIVVTVAGANDAPLSSLRVLVDGKEHCTTTPCRVALGSGTHFVRAEAPGFVATADRAVSVEGSGETTLHISLSPVDAAKPAAPAAEAVVNLDAEKSSAPAEPAPAAAPVAAAPRVPGKLAAAKPTDKKEDAKPAKPSEKPSAGVTGTLNINSIPVANVVLDGRPVGSTPIMGLAVSPGPHSVVFIHPEHGRKATGVNVEPGKTATAAVRF